MTGVSEGQGAPLRLALNHTRLADAGGVEAYLFRLVHSLLERGHAVDYFCARVERELAHPRFRVVRVAQPRLPRAWKVAGFARNSRRAIERAERLRGYDVVQGFGRTCYQTLYRDGSGCHADYRAAWLDSVKRGGARRAFEALSPADRVVQAIERARYATHPPRLVLAISRLVREQILRRYPLLTSRVRVLYSGVDLERFHPRLRGAGRGELLLALAGAGPELAPGARVWVFAGSDFGRKGLALLIDALARLEREGELARREVIVAVLGRDRREAAWRREAARRGVGARLRFLGFRRDMPALLAGADALLLPSFFDAFGNVVAEALACGTPAVVSARCGSAEWIRDGENGFTFARQDPEQLAWQLRALLAAEPARLRELARRSALAYGWDAHVDALLEIYREVAGAQRAER
jgi:UDP-glucose:(heptosyl)LPS alpha-1,3-glucosyltransferase